MYVCMYVCIYKIKIIYIYNLNHDFASRRRFLSFVIYTTSSKTKYTQINFMFRFCFQLVFYYVLCTVFVSYCFIRCALYLILIFDQICIPYGCPKKAKSYLML